MLVHFYTAIVESILTSSITIWSAAATAKDKGRLQCIIHSTEKVIDCPEPSRKVCTPVSMRYINTHLLDCILHIVNIL